MSPSRQSNLYSVHGCFPRIDPKAAIIILYCSTLVIVTRLGSQIFISVVVLKIGIFIALISMDIRSHFRDTRVHSRWCICVVEQSICVTIVLLQREEGDVKGMRLISQNMDMIK